MRHDFSAHFLRVQPPDTSFSEAWESLCFDLLRRDIGSNGLVRLRPPDRGIDILHRPGTRAYQCKSTQAGALGSIPAEASVESLSTAVQHRESLEWTKYCFATRSWVSKTRGRHARIRRQWVGGMNGLLHRDEQRRG